MKSLLFVCVVALCITSLFGCAAGEFTGGDSIMVQEVVRNPAKLRVGDVIVVRGKYTLHSQPKARLMISVTTHGAGGYARISPRSQMEIDAGSGNFELEYEIQQPGALHVSFYEFPYGRSFGRLEVTEVGP